MNHLTTKPDDQIHPNIEKVGDISLSYGGI